MSIDNQTDAIEVKTRSFDNVKVNRSAVQFGPLRITRGPAVPSSSSGRDGDLFILDNSDVPTSNPDGPSNPTVVGFYQKVSGSWSQFGTGGGGGGYVDPLTTLGDLVVRGASTTSRLGIGTAGQVLTVSGGTAAWANSPAGFANPMTADGDLITQDAGAAARLGVGTDGQVLTVVGGAPAWATSGTAPVTSVNGQTGAVTLSIPTLISELTNDSAFVNAAGAAAAAPVQSVNGQTGVVTITVPTAVSELTNDANFITAAGAPVQNVNGLTGSVTIAVPTLVSELANDANYITSASAPVRSVNSFTGDVILSIPTAVSQLTNDSGFVDAAAASAGAPVQSVNGGTGAVVLTIPTAVSELTNDSNFINAAGAPVQSVNGQTGAVTTFVDPSASDGDLIVHIGGAPTRLPIGLNGQVLSVNAGLVTWVNDAGLTPIPNSRVYNVDAALGDDSTGNGSLEKPLKTIVAALNAVTTNNTSSATIRLSTGNFALGTYNYSGPDDLTIEPLNAGGIDAALTIITGNLTISGTTNRFRARDVRFQSTTGVPLTFTGSGSAFNFVNCGFQSGDNSNGVTFNGTNSGFAAFYDCNFNTSVTFGGAPSAAMSVYMIRNVGGAAALTVNHANYSVIVGDALQLGLVTHTAGKMLMINVGQFAVAGADSIDSTASGGGDFLLLANVSTLGADLTTYKKINKTGSCAYEIVNSNRNPAIDVLTGTRVNIGMPASDMSFIPSAQVTSNTVQAAIQEVGVKATSYHRAFTNADLTAGVISITHGQNTAYPNFTIYDNNDFVAIPGASTFSVRSAGAALQIDFTASGGTIAGTWNIIVKG